MLAAENNVFYKNYDFDIWYASNIFQEVWKAHNCSFYFLFIHGGYISAAISAYVIKKKNNWKYD